MVNGYLTRARALALALVLFSAFGLLVSWWWGCTRGAEISFLPSLPPAEWILYASAPDAKPHPHVELGTVFRRAFSLETVPPQARLRVAGFHRYAVTINGDRLGNPSRPGRNWKQPDGFEVSKRLRAGQNEVLVTVWNSNGPPALWFALEAGGFRLSSDATWTCSYGDATWQAAQLARQPKLAPVGSPLRGGEAPWASWRSRWPTILLFAILSAAIYWLAAQARQSQTARVGLPQSAFRRIANRLADRDLVVITGLVVLWTALFLNNLAAVPALVGFDVPAHVQYIHYLQVRHALPLAGEGWEMFQPPLYYLLSAALLSLFGLPVSHPSSLIVLRLLGLAIGLAHLFVIRASLRLLFPNERSKQRWGLLLAGFLPPLFYLSQYTTNEALAAALVSGSLFLALRIIRQPRASWKAYAGLGLCLGAALLTKATAVLSVPVIIGGLLWKGLEAPPAASPKEEEPDSARLPLASAPSPALGSSAPAGEVAGAPSVAHWTVSPKGICLVLAVSLLVCGWHYGRVWLHYGNPLIGTWDPKVGFPWWQDDGYRTGAFYSRFGAVLLHPWFASLESFADGFYSTLWGDGLLGGMPQFLGRPPWNYDLMAAGYWLALPLTLAVLLGGALALAGFVRHPRAAWFMMLGLGFGVLAAVIHLSITIPCYGQVKAFYGLSAIIPFCACAALGLEALARWSTKLRILLCLGLGIWALNSYSSFWASPSSAAAAICRSKSLNLEGRSADAVQALQVLLANEPQDLDARALLVSLLIGTGDDPAAVKAAEPLRRDNPNHAEAQLALSALFQVRGRAAEASAHARRAVEAAPGYALAYERLAPLLVELENYDEAAEVCRRGLRLAPFSPDLHFNLGSALLLGRGDTNAWTQLNLALELKPGSTQARLLLAAALARRGRLEEATTCLSETLRRQPDNPQAHYQLALVLRTQHRTAQAIAEYARVLRLKPDFLPALNDLARIRATHPEARFRDGAEAVRLAERACQLAGDHEPILQLTLASAYAEAGHFDQALAAARKARDLADAASDTALAAQGQKLIALLTARQPFREPASGDNPP